MNGELTAALNKHGFSERGWMIMGYVGSIAHGTYVPKNNPNSIDDKDIMGVILPDENDVIGLGNWEGKQFMELPWDVCLYSLRKYIRLLLNCNPNVLGLLWLDETHYLMRSPEGQALIDAREIFVSKKAYHSFSGYAHGQLKRMTHLAFEGYMGKKAKRTGTEIWI